MTVINTNTLTSCFLDQSFKHFSDGEISVFYRGLVYIRGYTADEPSIVELVRRLKKTSLAECCHVLRGIYGIFVYDHAKNHLAAINDHIGLYKIFYDEDQLSTSFLELIRSKSLDSWELIDRAFVEFIAHGSVAGPDTFVTEIRQLRGDQVVHLTLDRNEISVKTFTNKLFPATENSATTLFKDLIDDMEVALKNKTISADLTGGLDSRLLVSCFKHTTLEFELATSGREDSEDVRIAHLAAELMSKRVSVMTHSLKPAGHEFDYELASLFEFGDAQTDPIRFHRLHQLSRDRLLRGVNTVVHGGGGEIYKDFHWLQDFPLFGLRRPNYKRYYTLRVAALSSKYFLSYSAQQLLVEVRTRSLSSYNMLKETNNVKGYLKVHSFIRSPEFYGRTFTNHINMGVDIFDPFLERAHIFAGMNLSVPRRLMNGWHRLIIQNNFPALAALETTEGYSAVAGLRFIGQLPKYFGVQIRRVARKLGQKLFGKSWFLELGADANNDRELYDNVRKGKLANSALSLVVKRGLVRKDVALTDIGNLHLGRLIAIGLFLQLFEQ